MRIAVARDEAFNFIYRANLDALKACAEVVCFSPLNDTALPACDLLYLPGGYPELFAAALEQNAAMREAIHDFAMQGGYIFAECGGMMYLTHHIEMDSISYVMCDVLPLECTMENAHLHLGYRKISADTQELKGHEFHYSEVREISSADLQVSCNQLSAKEKEMPTAVYRYKNVIAGYTHWYWAESGFEAFLKAFTSFA